LAAEFDETVSCLRGFGLSDRRRDAPIGDPQVGDRETTVRAEHVAAGNPQWSHRYPQDSKTICTRGVG
jgi:hypothetical protein